MSHIHTSKEKYDRNVISTEVTLHAVTASLQTATAHHAFQSLVYITDLVGLVLLAYTAGHIYVNLVRCSSSSWT